MLIGELLQSFGWPEEETIELAQAAAATLLGMGLERDAVLVWIDQIYSQPSRFLSDPALAPLAHARLRREPRALGEERSR
jgi:hypothetical protein